MNKFKFSPDYHKKSIHHQDFDKYFYIVRNPVLMKGVYVIGIICWIISMYGYVLFLDLNIWYWFIFGPFIFLLSFYYLLIYSINLFYKTPDLKAHRDFVEKFENQPAVQKPSVDIFLPVCGEKIEIITRTWQGVKNINYPNLKVLVLDDGGDSRLELMANNYGFEYLSRPDKGFMKKAGNLKYGFENSSSDYILIFDADFAPLPEFLNETIPYMQGDPNVAILQTPQYFEIHDQVHRRSWLEYGSAATQEDFYRIIQVARDRLGGAICVGTNAVYRRASLQTCGGTHQIEHSEDVWTGVMMLKNKFKIKYLPYILAQGYCPDDFIAYFKQQYRWCKGSMSLLFSKFFWKLEVPISAKLSYISGFLYYIHAAFPSFLSLIVFVVLTNNFDSISIYNTLPFIPFIIFIALILPFNRKHVPRLGVYLSSFAALTAYTLAISHSIFAKNMEWEPTGKKTKDNFWFNFMFNFNLIFISCYFILVGTFFIVGRLPFDNYEFYGIIGWIVYNLVIFSQFLFATTFDTQSKNINQYFENSSIAKTQEVQTD
jgi:cellulose synthase (UDP-forming)